ncbi:tetrathionate reductase beta subunit [Hydrogenivirga caldilitoris]|uniref:Tetrathionate reductase beta subunit n=1 Tax=Hydrogenivirga caldilitoris TaxID=246264 RepID=A0A497XVK3_9AQUI|nr:4Fe-4S dicluster domain-containing protein [Hydrogenivirga caldilitoris]RLJ71182.1 tetrathionate reductase beta subunit [Hydrogenivirga caldilitoris]
MLIQEGEMGTKVELSRREAIKLFSLAPVAAAVKTEEGKKIKWAMFIDVDKCYGCMACVVACAAENNVPIESFRTWIERHVFEDGRVVFVPKQCNHCENPPCVKPCPTGATYINEDGLVLVNSEICIGCASCVQACPYGARFMNPVTGTADKCTFCVHRIYEGRLPACVEACPTAARVFGNILDEETEVRKYVSHTPVQVLKPEYGTKPKYFYKNLPKEAAR